MAVLVFSLGSERFAVPAQHIRRIEYPTPVTPLPGGVPWLLGLANLLGEIVAVVDTRRWLGMPGQVTPAESRWLVLTFQGDLLALIIDQLPVLRVVPNAQSSSFPPVGRTTPCVCAELDLGGETVSLIDLAYLLSPSA